jgi:prepilin-type N-terminal cleavage/methylation domain-containing protein
VRINKGFTLIELLVVIAILGIIAALVVVSVKSARSKAADVRIKNDIRQMRWLAEVTYDAQKGNFTNWAIHAAVAADYAKLQADIDDAHGAATTISVGQTSVQSFCVSAPLKSDSNKHYCIDAGRELKEVTAVCPVVAPHVCP